MKTVLTSLQKVRDVYGNSEKCHFEILQLPLKYKATVSMISHSTLIHKHRIYNNVKTKELAVNISAS